MKRVLLVGGQRHGEWVQVEDNAWTFRVMRENRPIWDYNPESVEVPFEQDVYHLEKVPIDFQGVRAVIPTMILSGLFGTEKSLKVIQAIFQRDIAELFRTGEWDEFV